VTKPITEQRIAKSVLLGAELEIGDIIYLCSVAKPVTIRKVTFRPTEVIIDLRWPFDSPVPAQNPDDRLATRRDVGRFKRELRAYFLEQRAGKQLANVFHGQFVDFLPRFLMLTRFARLRRESGTVQDALDSIARQHKAGRLSGPREIIPPAIIPKLRRESLPILRATLEIQRLLTSWVLEKPQPSEAALKERIFENFDRDKYPWMRHFTRAFRLLEVKETRKVDGLHPSLSYPRQWSAVALARLIVKEKLKRDTGIDCPAATIAKIVKSPTRGHAK
jgi:hypothetical protein